MLDELIQLGQTKRPFLEPSIVYKDHADFQRKIGSMEIRLAAARNFAIQETDQIWAAGGKASAIERTRYRAATAYVHVKSSKIGSEIFGLGGRKSYITTQLFKAGFVISRPLANISRGTKKSGYSSVHLRSAQISPAQKRPSPSTLSLNIMNPTCSVVRGLTHLYGDNCHHL